MSPARLLPLSPVRTKGCEGGFRSAANLRAGLRDFAGRLCLGIALAALSATGMGCMVGPDYVRPVVEQPLYFKSQAASGEAPLMARDWWRLYGDPVLDQLIASAQASNQTLRQAVARVDQARALALVAVSFLSPTISLDPRFLRQRYSGNRDSTRTGQRQRRAVTINDWLIPLDLTYEIDVWGAFAAP